MVPCRELIRFFNKIRCQDFTPRIGISQSKTKLFDWRSSAWKCLHFNADIYKTVILAILVVTIPFMWALSTGWDVFTIKLLYIYLLEVNDSQTLYHQNAITDANFLNEQVLPFLDSQSMRTDDFGKLKTHDYQLCLGINDILSIPKSEASFLDQRHLRTISQDCFA